MNERIENLKNWAKKHKKAILLTMSGAAAGVGVLVFRNHYYVVSRKHDMCTLAKDSVPMIGEGELKSAMRNIGDLGIAWENSERINIELNGVPLSKLGETGEVLAKAVKDEDVGLLISYNK